MSTHDDPHLVSVPQLAEHAPSLQTSPDEQVFPQAPQLSGSDVASTQALPHSTPPLGHAHAPPLQSAPVAQAFPQAPQLAGSDIVSTHLPPHAASPPEQAQAPLPPAEQEVTAQAVAAANAALGEQTFSREWLAGAALGVDEVVAYALSPACA